MIKGGEVAAAAPSVSYDSPASVSAALTNIFAHDLRYLGAMSQLARRTADPRFRDSAQRLHLRIGRMRKKGDNPVCGQDDGAGRRLPNGLSLASV
jgi:hypothetical protein